MIFLEFLLLNSIFITICQIISFTFSIVFHLFLILCCGDWLPFGAWASGCSVQPLHWHPLFFQLDCSNYFRQSSDLFFYQIPNCYLDSGCFSIISASLKEHFLPKFIEVYFLDQPYATTNSSLILSYLSMCFVAKNFYLWEFEPQIKDTLSSTA